MNCFSRLPALLLAGWMPAAGLLAHPAVEPASRTDAWWTQRHESFNRRVAELGAKAQVLFIGDSITQGWEGEGKEVWARYYAPRQAINLGISGDRTQQVLWRLDHGNLDGLSPKAVVVMIGTNNSNGEDHSVEEIADGVAAIVARLRSRLPSAQVLLLPIFPRGEKPNPQRGKILQVNQILQKLVDDRAVHWVDFGHRFVTAAGAIPRDLMPDFLHLSPKAYGIWAEALEPRLSAVLGDAPVAAAATSSAGLTGDWVATLPGPNGDPVDLPFQLKQDGGALSGQFSRPDGRALKLEEGRVEGARLSWVLKRDRPGGEIMVYRMSAELDGGALKGETRTEMDGNPITLRWTAKRK
ncbi:MAG: platelet-activating factor acetylhydrolase IB subunit [Verrucomicrobiota bacterium]